MGMEELHQKLLREIKHCLDAGVSVLEMNVKAKLKKIKSLFSTEISRRGIFIPDVVSRLTKQGQSMSRRGINLQDLPSSHNESPFCETRTVITDGTMLSFTSWCSFTGFKDLKAWVETLVDILHLPPP